MGRWVDEGLGLVREMTLYKRRSAICNVATERGVREQLDIERRTRNINLSFKFDTWPQCVGMRLCQNIGVSSLQNYFKDPDAELQPFSLSFYLSSDFSISSSLGLEMAEEEMVAWGGWRQRQGRNL